MSKIDKCRRRKCQSTSSSANRTQDKKNEEASAAEEEEEKKKLRICFFFFVADEFVLRPIIIEIKKKVSLSNKSHFYYMNSSLKLEMLPDWTKFYFSSINRQILTNRSS